MNDRFERITMGTLAFAALVIAVTFAHREFSGRGVPAELSRGSAAPLQYLADWKDLVAVGRTIGDTAAPIKMIEFGDFECSYCKRFEKEMRAVAARYGPAVSSVFIELPLRSHKFALPAARAAECAANQGRFAEIHDALFEKQDSLGLKSWVSFARDAGVSDSARFARCVTDTVHLAAVDRGIALARKLGLKGTPTIVVNGWLFPTPPAESTLMKSIETLRSGRAQPAIGGDRGKE